MTRKKAKSKHIKRKSSSSTLRLVLILLIVAAITIFLTFFIKVLVTPKPYLVETIPYDFRMKLTLGFNADTDMLHLGGGPPGATLGRELYVEADLDSFVSVTWVGPGNLRVNESEFIVLRNETKVLMFTMPLTADLPVGNYSGEIYLAFYELK